MASEPAQQPEQVASADSTSSLLLQFSAARTAFEAELHDKIQADMKECEERNKPKGIVITVCNNAEESEAYLSGKKAKKEAQMEHDEQNRAKMIEEECTRFKQLWLINNNNDDGGFKKKVEEGLEEIHTMAKDYLELQKDLILLDDDVDRHEQVQLNRLSMQIQDHRHWQQSQFHFEWITLSQQPRETSYDMLGPLHLKQEYRGGCMLQDSFDEIMAAFVSFRTLPMREQLQQKSEMLENMERLFAQDVANVDRMLAEREAEFLAKLERDQLEVLALINFWRCAG